MNETKVILIALSKIVRDAKSTEEVYDTLIEMAEAEGVKLSPFNVKNDKKTEVRNV